jgi:hypothetical protein
MTPNDEKSSPRFFYGLQAHWLSLDRLYRVYVSDKMIAGAYIAGQFYDERLAALMLQSLFLLFRPLVRRCLARRKEREAHYDAVDPFTPSFLDLDPRNFQLQRTDVVRTWFRRNRNWHMPLNLGTVELELLDGTKRRFILLEQQEPEAVLQLMRSFDPAIEATGKPNPLQHKKPMTPTQKRVFYAVMALIFLASGVFLGYVQLAGLARNLFHLPMAVIGVLTSIWCVAQACKSQKTPPGSDASG